MKQGLNDVAEMIFIPLGLVLIFSLGWFLRGCVHGEPIGGGNTGGEQTSYSDKEWWYCYDEQGKRWPSNGECD